MKSEFVYLWTLAFSIAKLFVYCMDRFVFEKVSIVVNYGEKEAKVSSIFDLLIDW